MALKGASGTAVQNEIDAGSSFEHVQVHRGIFVAGETDETDFAGLFRFENGLHFPPAGRRCASGSFMQ